MYEKNGYNGDSNVLTRRVRVAEQKTRREVCDFYYSDPLHGDNL